MSVRPMPPEPTAADYARALERGVSRLRFEPAVETEFRRSHTIRMRTQARLWQIAQLLLGFIGIGILLGGAREAAPPGLLFACAAVHLAVSITLIAVAFSRAYVESYLRIAAILTPFRLAAFGIVVAAIVATGGTGTAAMTINLFGLLFFSGLLLRQSLPAALVMTAAFLASLGAFGVPESQALYSSTSMLVVLGLASFVAWDTQRAARRAFLERGLTRADATRDALTGLVNRRGLDARLAALWKACGESGQRLTVLLLDVDHFKLFNDSYGHQAGDEALRAVAGALQAESGEGCVVARFGGEEMAVLATGLGEHEAEALAGRLRRAVEALEIPHAGAAGNGKLTISIGGACIVPLPGRSAAGALQLADQNLYSAKRRGRNTVVFHEDEYETLQTGVFRHVATGRTTR